MGIESKEESKERVDVSRTEAVQRIRALLDQLGQGSVTVGDRTFQVPEQIHLEMKAEADELDFELTW